MSDLNLFDRDETDERIKRIKKTCIEHIENERFAQAENSLSRLQSLAERRHILDKILDKAEQEGIDFSKSKQETLE